MDEIAAAEPLSFLLGSVSVADFFDRYHEQRALHCGHADSGRFAALLSIARIDEILSGTDLKPAALSMARDRPPLKRSDYTYKSGNIDRGAVIRHYQRGATIILNQLQRADARLARFCRSLENVFSCQVQTNVYLTPPANKGFKTHYDDHDVFIIQVSGAKRWRLYESPVENPYRGEAFRAAAHKPGELEQEFLLQAGDCLYIPRGLMHDAASHGDEPSLHITAGLLVKKWADLMLEAVAEVALRNPAFRRSLPPGFARRDCDDERLQRQFRDLAREFAEQADFGKVLAYFRESFLRQRRPDLRGALLDAASPVAEDVLYIRRPLAPARLRHDDSKAVIIGPGGSIQFDLAALAGLRLFLSGEPFGMAAFVGMDREQQRDAVRRLSAFGLIERAP